MIKSPSTPANHPDRGLHCEMALEDEFRALAERGEAAGWPSDTVAAALLSLSLKNIEFRKATAGDGTRLWEARRKAGH